MKLRFRPLLATLATVVVTLATGLYLYSHEPIDRIPSSPVDLIPSNPDAEDNLTFFALGDQGTGEPQQWAVAHGMEKAAERYKDLDFVLLMGDNFYTKIDSIDSPEWLSRFEHVYAGAYLDAVPFYAVLGNHDYRSDPQIQIDYMQKHMGSNRWRMPGHYYSQDFGKVNGRPLLRMVFIDTMVQQDQLTKEADFIRSSFAESANAPIWRVVTGHFPVYSYGKHAGEMPAMVDTILPALRDAKVDFYLSGHDHNQQVIAHAGEPYYFISGGGGSDLYSVKTGSPDLRYALSKYGFLGLHLDASRLRIGNYDADGTLKMAYTVERRCTYGQASCLVQSR